MKSNSASTNRRQTARGVNMRSGVEGGLVPEKIMGVTKTTQGELVFFVKWATKDEPDLVPAKLANVKYPQLVIKFYEGISVWR